MPVHKVRKPGAFGDQETKRLAGRPPAASTPAEAALAADTQVGADGVTELEPFAFDQRIGIPDAREMRARVMAARKTKRVRQIVVIHLAPAKNAEQRMVDDAKEAVVKQGGDAMLTALDRLDDLFIARRLLTLTSPWEEAQRRADGTFGA